jgi:hypothetical protein
MDFPVGSPTGGRGLKVSEARAPLESRKKPTLLVEHLGKAADGDEAWRGPEGCTPTCGHGMQ